MSFETDAQSLIEGMQIGNYRSFAYLVKETIVSGGAGINQLTGDVTAGPGTGSQVATLANTAVTAGSYTYSSITVDANWVARWIADTITVVRQQQRAAADAAIASIVLS